MTIAVALKVQDGVVLASDSASTLLGAEGFVANVYNNADKIVNLRKGLPVGIMFWGAGGIGTQGMSTLARDLRLRFLGEDPNHGDWELDPAGYSLEGVAMKAREFLIEEHYNPTFADLEVKPDLGFLVAGYSAGAALSEGWEVIVSSPDGECTGPIDALPAGDSGGTIWRGQPEAISRLVFGVSPLAIGNFMEGGLGEEEAVQAWTSIKAGTEVVLWHSAMPMQDAIDLAEFLVDLSKQFSRFLPGAASVGGPTEIAAITKHEGFKWVRRKHYYESMFNPPDNA